MGSQKGHSNLKWTKATVGLARALVINPANLLLDEPLSALDVQNQMAMRRELRERIQSGKVLHIIVTIVLVTRPVSEIKRVIWRKERTYYQDLQTT